MTEPAFASVRPASPDDDVPDVLAGLDVPEDDEPTPPGSLLEELRDGLSKPVVKPPLVVDHVYREGWSMRYSSELDADTLKRLQRGASKKARRGREAELDEFLFACLVLAQQNTGLLIRGQLIEHEGRPLRINSRYMFEVLAEQTEETVATAADAVAAFYGDDALLSSHAAAVMESCGYGRDAEEGAGPSVLPPPD